MATAIETLDMLVIVATLGMINREAGRYLRGVITAEEFADLACEHIVRASGLLKGPDTPH